jgi:hypothetical protein
MIDPNWSRWIFASIAKHFDDAKQNIPLYIDGQDRTQTPPVEGAELRVNGPFINNPSKGYYLLMIDVNILLNVTFSSTDSYKLWRTLGIFLTAFDIYIPVRKYGDDDSLLGCLRLIPNRGDEIIISHFGQVSPDIRLYQSAIDAMYELELKI